MFERVGDGVSDDWFSGKVREAVALMWYLVVKNKAVVHYEKYMQDLQLPHWLCWAFRTSEMCVTGLVFPSVSTSGNTNPLTQCHILRDILPVQLQMSQ